MNGEIWKEFFFIFLFFSQTHPCEREYAVDTLRAQWIFFNWGDFSCFPFSSSIPIIRSKKCAVGIFVFLFPSLEVSCAIIYFRKSVKTHCLHVALWSTRMSTVILCYCICKWFEFKLIHVEFFLLDIFLARWNFMFSYKNRHEEFCMPQV